MYVVTVSVNFVWPAGRCWTSAEELQAIRSACQIVSEYRQMGQGQLSLFLFVFSCL